MGGSKSIEIKINSVKIKQMDRHWLRSNIANIITSSRIIGTTIMLFLPALSPAFLVIYAYAGLTDAIDGFIARKLDIVSEFGTKLDSISDLIFFVTMMIKILPYLIHYLPHAIMLTVYAIFAFRVLIYIYVGLLHHKLLSTHQYLNKATGFLLYFVPFVIKTKIFTVYASIICAVAAAAAINEVRMLCKNTQQ